MSSIVYDIPEDIPKHWYKHIRVNKITCTFHNTSKSPEEIFKMYRNIKFLLMLLTGSKCFFFFQYVCEYLRTSPKPPN